MCVVWYNIRDKFNNNRHAGVLGRGASRLFVPFNLSPMKMKVAKMPKMPAMKSMPKMPKTMKAMKVSMSGKSKGFGKYK